MLLIVEAVYHFCFLKVWPIMEYRPTEGEVEKTFQGHYNCATKLPTLYLSGQTAKAFYFTLLVLSFQGNDFSWCL